jgi:hypothetical protein
MSVETLLVFINGASSTQLCFTRSFLTTSPRSSLLLRCLEFCHRPKCPPDIEWVQSSPPPALHTHTSHFVGYVPFQQHSTKRWSKWLSALLFLTCKIPGLNFRPGKGYPIFWRFILLVLQYTSCSLPFTSFLTHRPWSTFSLSFEETETQSLNEELSLVSLSVSGTTMHCTLVSAPHKNFIC